MHMPDWPGQIGHGNLTSRRPSSTPLAGSRATACAPARCPSRSSASAPCRLR